MGFLPRSFAAPSSKKTMHTGGQGAEHTSQRRKAGPDDTRGRAGGRSGPQDPVLMPLAKRPLPGGRAVCTHVGRPRGVSCAKAIALACGVRSRWVWAPCCFPLPLALCVTTSKSLDLSGSWFLLSVRWG